LKNLKIVIFNGQVQDQQSINHLKLYRTYSELTDIDC
jgi:hypothetical protein